VHRRRRGLRSQPARREELRSTPGSSSYHRRPRVREVA
jgi:hypothetical protein